MNLEIGLTIDLDDNNSYIITEMTTINDANLLYLVKLENDEPVMQTEIVKVINGNQLEAASVEEQDAMNMYVREKYKDVIESYISQYASMNENEVA